MSDIVFVVQQAPKGGLTARGLVEPIFTEAELRIAVADAVHCHFDKDMFSKVLRLHPVRGERLSAWKKR
ncbi:2-oxoisovalerate dehydrogenase E1 subunit beta [Polaromonas sp.]|uniref:2-oxoisovalerate dehydrogenase E1 subunit beta n=1 Tax=Polaromonas sp. TaxID=1869339 RepID=UPI00375042D9